MEMKNDEPYFLQTLMVLLGCSEKENNEITFQIFKANTHDWETQHVSLKGSRKEKQRTDLTVEPSLY